MGSNIDLLKAHNDLLKLKIFNYHICNNQESLFFNELKNDTIFISKVFGIYDNGLKYSYNSSEILDLIINKLKSEC